MARDHARIKTSRQRDNDWRGEAAAKRLTQDTLFGGVA